MASSSSSSSSSSSLLLLLLATLLFASIIGISQAKDFLVGGSTHGWKIPSSTSDSLNKWAESTRFQVGDSLVWRYDGKKDSVLQVTRKDYLSCNTSSPVAAHSDGKTVIRLRRSGPYYFIGGAEGACEKGEKLIVVVMAPRRMLAPAPSPMMFDGPAVAPTSGGPLMVVVNWGLMGAALLVTGVFGVLF